MGYLIIPVLFVVAVVLFTALVALVITNKRHYGAWLPGLRARRTNALPAAATPDQISPAAPAMAGSPSTPSSAELAAGVASVPQAATAFLVQQVADRLPVRYLLDRPITVVGRDPGCDIRIDDRYVTISRRHAQIVQEGGAYVLSDLASSSGVYVNGARIGRNRLRDGAVIRLGHEIEYVFHAAPTLSTAAGNGERGTA